MKNTSQLRLPQRKHPAQLGELNHDISSEIDIQDGVQVRLLQWNVLIREPMTATFFQLK